MEQALEIEIPCYFLCPISMQLMRDPVTVSTGITYDRENIEKWLFSCKKTTCPVTKQHISTTDLTPNHTLRRLIQTWCTSLNTHETTPTSNPPVTESPEPDTTTFLQVLENGNSPARTHAIISLKSAFHVADPERLMGSDPALFIQIVHILKDKISSEATKAALKLLIELCPWGRNRVKAVENGAVWVLIDSLIESDERRACELILHALDQLCCCAEGRAELLRHGAGLAVVSKKILRVSNAASERAVRILSSISKHSATSRVLCEMIHVGVVSKLCLVLQVNCGNKIKERATEILRMHSRVWTDSSCIPPHLLSSYPS